MKLNLVKMLTIGLLPSFLKVAYYRARGYRIEQGVSIGLFSIIDAGEVSIGRDTKVSMFCSISGKTLRMGKRVSIGMFFIADCREVYIGHDTSVAEFVLVGAMPTPRSKLIIGQRVNILPFCIFNPSRTIFIGNNTGIGSHVSILTHASSLSVFEGFPVMFGKVVIENNAWVSWNVTITLNAFIGRNSMVNAGAVVSSSIPRGAIAAGVPAREIVTDGAYIRKSALKNAPKIMRNIIEDMADFLQDQGKHAEKLLSKDTMGINFECHGKIRKLSVQHPGSVSADNVDIVVSLEALSEKDISQLQEASVCWFDVRTKRTGGTRHDCWKWTRDFLFRYGVRFRVIE